MRNFIPVFCDLFLSRIPGYYRMTAILNQIRTSQIPYNDLPAKLNLGCSTRPLPGYTNVDARSECKPDVVANVRDLPFDDESFELVRASHVLEHFPPHEMPNVLREWWRVLKPGGYLVIAVPNHIRLSWRSILAPGRLSFAQFDNGWINGIFALDLPPEFRHQNVFTEHSLRDSLLSAGFFQVRKINWRVEDPFRLGIVDDSVTPYSLNVIAIKQ